MCATRYCPIAGRVSGALQARPSRTVLRTFIVDEPVLACLQDQGLRTFLVDVSDFNQFIHRQLGQVVAGCRRTLR